MRPGRNEDIYGPIEPHRSPPRRRHWHREDLRGTPQVSHRPRRRRGRQPPRRRVRLVARLGRLRRHAVRGRRRLHRLRRYARAGQAGCGPHLDPAAHARPAGGRLLGRRGARRGGEAGRPHARRVPVAVGCQPEGRPAAGRGPQLPVQHAGPGDRKVGQGRHAGRRLRGGCADGPGRPRRRQSVHGRLPAAPQPPAAVRRDPRVRQPPVLPVAAVPARRRPRRGRLEQARDGHAVQARRPRRLGDRRPRPRAAPLHQPQRPPTPSK